MPNNCPYCCFLHHEYTGGETMTGFSEWAIIFPVAKGLPPSFGTSLNVILEIPWNCLLPDLGKGVKVKLFPKRDPLEVSRLQDWDLQLRCSYNGHGHQEGTKHQWNMTLVHTADWRLSPFHLSCFYFVTVSETSAAKPKASLTQKERQRRRASVPWFTL